MFISEKNEMQRLNVSEMSQETFLTFLKNDINKLRSYDGNHAQGNLLFTLKERKLQIIHTSNVGTEESMPITQSAFHQLCKLSDKKNGHRLSGFMNLDGFSEFEKMSIANQYFMNKTQNYKAICLDLGKKCEVVGVVSPKHRSIQHWEILDAMFDDICMKPVRLSLSGDAGRMECFLISEGRTFNDGDSVFHPGVKIENNLKGEGKLIITFGLYRALCSNLQIWQTKTQTTVEIIHSGRNFEKKLKKAIDGVIDFISGDDSLELFNKIQKLRTLNLNFAEIDEAGRKKIIRRYALESELSQDLLTKAIQFDKNQTGYDVYQALTEYAHRQAKPDKQSEVEAGAAKLAERLFSLIS